MSPRKCPPADYLECYSNGVLSDAQAETINAHLENCPTCLETLNTLATQPDRFVAALRSPAATNMDFHPALVRALEGAAAPTSSPAHEPGSVPQPGSAISDYRIIDELGRGGMGRVYRALHPRLNQEVALKVLRPGMDSGPILKRFDAERQALALMDHPYIARVLDGGVTEDDRSFFVMELVRGVPITTYADEHRLNLRTLLEVFIRVCQAVQHAHQKGIIHRDLKPSNVLVSEYDGTPAPKVIDFGVAKALEPRTTMQTEVGMLVGTPEYMSPEQTDLTALDIDTRSDVYALGIILYELLTGDTPFGRTRTRETPILEMLRIIREEEPAAPSLRLAAEVDATKLAKEVRGELDWIVLKCLEKDRSRRYETASALAEDVRRFLNSEPVLAGPPSRAYQFKKFVSRNRVSVTAAASVFVVLVAGIAVSTALAVWALRAEKDAKADRDTAVAAGERADEAAAIAKAVNDFFQNDVIRIADTDQQALQRQSVTPNITVKQAVDRAAERIGHRFQNQPLVEAAIRNAIGDAYLGLGEPRLAVPHLERAMGLEKSHRSPEDPNVLTSMRYLAKAYYEAGKLNDALQLNREILRLRRSSNAPDDPDLRISRDILMEAYHGGTNLTDALMLHEEVLPLQKLAWGLDHPETLDSMWGLATGYNLADRIDDAVMLCEELLPLMRNTLGPDHANTLSCMGGLAGLYGRQGRHSLAISLRNQSLELFKSSRGWDHPDTVSDMVGLAHAYIEASQLVEGIALHEEALKLRRIKLGDDHPRTLQSITLLASAWEKANDFAKAELLLQDMTRLTRDQFGSNHFKVAACLAHLGRNLLRQHRYTDAESHLREALAINENLGSDDWETAQIRCVLGEALLGQQNYSDAEPLLLKGHEGLTKHQEQLPATQRQRLLAAAIELLVKLYDASGKPDAAAQWREKLGAAPNSE